MILLLFVFGLSLVFGFYFLAAGVLRLPSMGAARAIAERGSGKQKVTGFLEDGMDHLSVLLARHITLDEYRKRRMGNILNVFCDITLDLGFHIRVAMACQQGGILA